MAEIAQTVVLAVRLLLPQLPENIKITISPVSNVIPETKITTAALAQDQIN